MENKKTWTKSVLTNLGVYGIGHFLIDATSIGVLFSLSRVYSLNVAYFFVLLLLYNILAFGLQIFIGIYVDRYQVPRGAAVFGCILTIIGAVLLGIFPLFAVIFVGIGNAFFHIGGGVISLNLTPKKASAPGVYVAPGAFGLFFGLFLGKGGYFINWIFILLLILLIIVIFLVKLPKINYNQKKARKNFNYFELILILVLLVIVFRSLIGMVFILPWKSSLDLLIALTLGVVLGKAFGGIIADKFGWVKVAVVSLLISAPLLYIGINIPIFGIMGMFLFNFTMPITLVAISNMFPGKAGFSFGLTCLALLIGALPSFTRFQNILNNPILDFILIIISAIVLFFGLKLFFKGFNGKEIFE